MHFESIYFLNLEKGLFQTHPPTKSRKSQIFLNPSLSMLRKQELLCCKKCWVCTWFVICIHRIIPLRGSFIEKQTINKYLNDKCRYLSTFMNIMLWISILVYNFNLVANFYEICDTILWSLVNKCEKIVTDWQGIPQNMTMFNLNYTICRVIFLLEHLKFRNCTNIKYWYPG